MSSIDPSTFDALVQIHYDRLPDELINAFEQIGGIAIEDCYPANPELDQGVPTRCIAGLWHPQYSTVFIYRHAAAGMDALTLDAHIERTLRHEIGHALGMDHTELEQLDL